MAYYFSTAIQQNTNASANTTTTLANIHAIAGLRAYLQKVICGSYATPADNAIRIQVLRTTTLLTAGTGITPAQQQPDGGAANAVATTLPTGGAFAAVPVVQLAFNQRGTAMWAAFNADEAVAILGATAPNSELAFNSQSTGTTVPVNMTFIHSE